jgi:hypothetical protein
MRPDQVLDSDLYARLGTNDVRTRQFDATTSFIAPAGEAWYAIAENQRPAPELAAILTDLPVMVTGHTLVDNSTYRLSHIDLEQRLLAAARRSTRVAQNAALPIKFGETAELLGYDVQHAQDRLTLVTYWRAGDHIITPLQMFVHVLKPDGSIGVQADRLDASADDWQPGDLIAQVHHIDLPPNLKDYLVAIGLYNPTTGMRLTFNAGGQIHDRLVLTSADLP